MENLQLILTMMDKAVYISTQVLHTFDEGHWRELIKILCHPINNIPTDLPTQENGDNTSQDDQGRNTLFLITLLLLIIFNVIFLLLILKHNRLTSNNFLFLLKLILSPISPINPTLTLIYWERPYKITWVS